MTVMFACDVPVTHVLERLPKCCATPYNPEHAFCSSCGEKAAPERPPTPRFRAGFTSDSPPEVLKMADGTRFSSRAVRVDGYDVLMPPKIMLGDRYECVVSREHHMERDHFKVIVASGYDEVQAAVIASGQHEERLAALGIEAPVLKMQPWVASRGGGISQAKPHVDSGPRDHHGDCRAPPRWA